MALHFQCCVLAFADVVCCSLLFGGLCILVWIGFGVIPKRWFYVGLGFVCDLFFVSGCLQFVFVFGGFAGFGVLMIWCFRCFVFPGVLHDVCVVLVCALH